MAIKKGGFLYIINYEAKVYLLKMSFKYLNCMETLFTVQSSGCIYQIEKPPWTWLFTCFVISLEKKNKLS